MKCDVDCVRSLESGLLRLYKRALAEGRWATAEHLMCALEDLEKSSVGCRSAVEEAYLAIGRGENLRVRGPAPRPMRPAPRRRAG